MLLLVLKTGLTHSRRVWREGEIFDSNKGDTFRGFISREYKEDMSEEAWEAKQLRYYGEPMFRRLTDTELRDAFAKGLVILEQMTPKQKKVISGAIKGKIDEIRVTSEKLKQEVKKIEKEEIEVEEEETVEVKEEEILELEEEEEVIPGQVVQEGSELIAKKDK